VFGESPVASTLVRLAELTGFRIRQVAQAELASLDVPTGDVYGIVATMGHFDEDALEAALTRPHLEVSLIASTRRAAAVRAELLRRGLGEDSIARIHSPTGKVRGGTQEEIALLVLAELVSARRKDVPKALATAAPAVLFATDPVCGMTVDVATTTHTAEHSGRTFYFCSAGCGAEFKREPAKYLKAVEA
jgi:xanthine dehydrogenase accessory factor